MNTNLSLKYLNDKIEALSKLVDNFTGDITNAKLFSYPSQGSYIKGTSFNQVLLISKMDIDLNTIKEVTYYKNGVQIFTDMSSNINKGESRYIDNNLINSDTIYKIAVKDIKNRVFYDVIKLNFVDPMYIGFTKSDKPTADEIKNYIELIKINQDFAYSFNLTNEKICFAYPATYGLLKSIYDENKFNIIKSFIQYNLDVQTNNNTISYNIYILDRSVTVSDYYIEFGF